jgi:hypothetical protein
LREEKLLNKFIEDDFSKLENMMSLLSFFKLGNKVISSENLSVEFSDTETKIKYYCFLTSSYLDLMTSLKGFLNQKTKWEIIYYSKYSFLIIYETIKTFHKYQTDFRAILEKDFMHLKDDYNRLNDALKIYKNKYDYDNKISTIRNKTGGHFNEDFLIYYEQITKLEKLDSVNAITDFLEFLKSLIDFIYRMADEGLNSTLAETEKTQKELIKKMQELNEIIQSNKN